MFSILKEKRRISAHKLLKFWAQSFLPGIPTLIVGFRDDDGNVVTVETFKTIEIPRLVRGKDGAWDTTICTNFLDGAFNFLRKIIVVDNPEVTYTVGWACPYKAIKIEYAGKQNKFLSDRFLKSILCRDQHGAADVKLLMKDYIRQVHADCLPPTPTSFDAADYTDSGSNSALSLTKRKRNRRAGRPSKVKVKNLPQPLLYAKDVSCPKHWRANVTESGILPQFLTYMGENDLNALNGHAAENLFIYIGQAGTWTPAHIDQCASIGQNIMVWADKDSSSMWFMVRAEDRPKAEALWSSFGQRLEHENYFATVDELAKADFPIYVVEQKIGDFVMVPSQSCNQVVNLGKATIKVAWARLMAECLKTAITQDLPHYREIARPEGYRIKMITHSTLQTWTEVLESQSTNLTMSKEQFCESYKLVLNLFKTIVEDDWVDLNILDLPRAATFERPKRLINASPAACDFCQTDLWNRQFQCTLCTSNGDNYDICMRCYTLGRGCAHRTNLRASTLIGLQIFHRASPAEMSVEQKFVLCSPVADVTNPHFWSSNDSYRDKEHLTVVMRKCNVLYLSEAQASNGPPI
ncbi:hypothetical protein EC968_010155 [Mortierella alpina]|nr:hypothetical protein EC968_010155 [Mortierella alpina]